MSRNSKNDTEKANRFAASFLKSAKLSTRDLEFSDDGFSAAVYQKALEIHSLEFANREIADWKRARSVIEHENILINHRITWLLWAQAALFAVAGVLVRMLFEYRSHNKGLSIDSEMYLSDTDILAPLLIVMLVGFFSQCPYTLIYLTQISK